VGKGSKPTIGFRYFFGLHIGVSRGPIDEFMAIEVDNKRAWTGSVTGNQQIYINRPNLFGGDKGEGGIQGTLDVLMGAPDQAPLPYLQRLHGTLLPAFRGVFTMVFNGLICSFSKSPKPWKVRVRRSLKGWENDDCWYPEKAVIPLRNGAIKAMNPAHIILQVTTDRRVGRGLDRAFIDLDSFAAAADTLAAEGFGLCMRWTRSSDVNEFLQIVADHIGAVCVPEYSTGLLTLRLIRDDYDPETIPLFTRDSGLLGIDEDDSAARADAVNEIVVTWRDPITDKDGQVRVTDPAGVQSAGRTISQAKAYPGLPTEDLAKRIAQRDVTIAASGLKRYKVRLDRRGYKLRPGQPFRISDPDSGIENVILRAGTKNGGTLADGTITIVGLQDVFGLPATSWVNSQTSTHTPVDTEAKPASERRVFEASYRDLARNLTAADLEARPAEICTLGALAARPPGLTYNFELATRTGSGEFALRGAGDWVPNGVLATDITATATSVTLLGAQDLDQVEVGFAALVDNEVWRIDSINADTGAITMGRGCVDTIPAAHIAGTVVWIYDDAGAFDLTEYLEGEEVDAKVLTRTSTELLDPDDAPTDTLEMIKRQALPYPPGRVRINGEPAPAAVSGSFTVTWAHRDRLLQLDQLIDSEASSIGPEATTRYALRFFNVLDELIVEKLDIAGNTATVVLDHTGGTTMELYAISDNGESWQKHERTFTYTPPVVPVVPSVITAGSYSPVETVIDGGEVTP
jgi:hypothetical protein